MSLTANKRDKLSMSLDMIISIYTHPSGLSLNRWLNASNIGYNDTTKEIIKILLEQDVVQLERIGRRHLYLPTNRARHVVTLYCAISKILGDKLALSYVSNYKINITEPL